MLLTKRRETTKGGKIMLKLFEKFVADHGLKIGAFAIAIATVAPKCCRCEWYEEKEPKNLQKLLNQSK
jgi:cyclic lactone autoinducer peptide